MCSHTHGKGNRGKDIGTSRAAELECNAGLLSLCTLRRVFPASDADLVCHDAGL